MPNGRLVLEAFQKIVITNNMRTRENPVYTKSIMMSNDKRYHIGEKMMAPSWLKLVTVAGHKR